MGPAARRPRRPATTTDRVGRAAAGDPDEPVAPWTGDPPPNLRDVGDLPLNGGGRTHRGILLRSAEPLPGDRLPTGVSDVVDLRSPAEVTIPHPAAGPGTRVWALALLGRPLPGPGGDWSAVPDLPTAYLGFLADGAPRIVAVLGVAARAEGAVLVHCAAGKDRTGVVVAVLLRAAGVARPAIVADYLATAAHLPAVRARRRVDVGPADPTHRQRLMGTPAEAVEAVLDVLDAHAGGATGWLLDRGADAAHVTAWRARIRAGRTDPTALGDALDPIIQGR